MVALLGGAFDPIHLDHLRMAEECLRWKLADEVWLVVAPDLRWDKKTVASAADRLAMVHLSLEREDRILSSDLEIQVGEYRGTLRLLERLQEQHPSVEFRWLIGSDSYSMIPLWRDPTQGSVCNGEELLRRFSLLVWPRLGCEMPDPEIHRNNGWKPLIMPPQEAWFNARSTSSSEVRRRLQEGEPLEGLVPQAVIHYIIEHNLYRSAKPS